MRTKNFLLAIGILLLPLPTAGAEQIMTLSEVLHHAVEENPELKVKRHSLEIAQARLRQAGLLLQHNPNLSVALESKVSGNTGTGVELNLMQELEIGGQGKYRSVAAAKYLLQTRLAIDDSERQLRLDVTRAFYHLLALQDSIETLQNVLAAQEQLLATAQRRFSREDISILEFNALRLDRDQAHSQLASKLSDREVLEKQLRSLAGFQDGRTLVASGNLLRSIRAAGANLSDRETTQECAATRRPDIQAAKAGVDLREAELRLAEARRVPNISVGPRYKRDFNQHIVGAGLAIPLPFFNNNQEEIATALANRNASKSELDSRLQAAKREIASVYNRLRLAQTRMNNFGPEYLAELERMLALAGKAYASGEMTVFEFSQARDRLKQARSWSLDAALAYALAIAELESQAPGCLR